MTSRQMAERLLRIHALQEELTSSPYSHDIIELALATATSLPVLEQDESGLVWMLIVGLPSSDKTQTVLQFQGAPHTFYLDSLTENSFASGYVTSEGRATSKDLLPELDGKCFIIKDLTTLFSMREEKVRQIFGDLQSICDGEYAKATGTLQGGAGCKL
jgi:hypothetical protein